MQAPRRSRLRLPAPALMVAIAGALLTLGLVAAESIVALAILLMDGGVALGAIAGAALSGGWLLVPLRLNLSRAERLILGAALGVGLLSLVILGLGTAGALTWPVAVAICAVLGLAGVVRVVLDFEIPLTARQLRAREQDQAASSEPSPGSTPSPAPGMLRRVARPALWILVVPFLVLTILGACLPPGVLWDEEGLGYDVLEYHLAVPKTFFEQGRISFLAHNVYSNFPMNSEMLSLLMMTLRGDSVEAAFMATVVNVALGALFVAAAWCTVRRIAPRGGTVAGVLAATLPWIGYLAAIAYVEPGMLATGMCALLALAPVAESNTELRRRALLGGLLAGLSCGYKYTAVPLIALPLAVLPLAAPAPLGRRFGAAVIFGAAALLTFAPWPARNVVNTGNPVFPLAWSAFGAKPGTWDPALQERWARAHGSSAAEHTDVPAWWRAVERTLGDYRMGGTSFGFGDRFHAEDDGTLQHQLRYHVVPGALFVIAFIGVVRGRARLTRALLLMLLVQIAVWASATHLFARFAVVMLLPLLVLAGQALGTGSGAVEGVRRHLHVAVAAGVYALVVLGGMVNLYRFSALYYHHTRRPGGDSIQAYGHVDWFVNGAWPGTQHLGVINQLEPGARVMLVGDARSYYLRTPCEYATVFNHHPLAAAIRESRDLQKVVEWLRERGTTHVLVHWVEIDRLSRTYGFEPELDPNRDPTLYERLVAAGLREASVFALTEGMLPYATLYEVPRQ